MTGFLSRTLRWFVTLAVVVVFVEVVTEVVCRFVLKAPIAPRVVIRAGTACGCRGSVAEPGSK